jgi:niacin transporter
MQRKISVERIALSGVLCAVGILIPMIFPKIAFPPASFTLASHVPIFIAMFISPGVAAAVCLGTTLGFVFSGLPLPIWLRAATHILFALIGAAWIKKDPSVITDVKKSAVFAVVTGVIHALCEVLVLVPLFYNGGLEAYEAGGFFYSVVLLVGVGTLIHSCIDFAIAWTLWRGIGGFVRKSA